MLTEQRLRAILFYLSVLVFFTGLPVILTFALGYKFDPRTLKFTKTGLVVIKTQPEGAAVFLDGKLVSEKTPYTITEVLPGNYALKIELPEHYPWSAEIEVEANKITRLEKIILFPLRPDIKQIGSELDNYWVDEKTKTIYYSMAGDKNLYKTNSEGERNKIVGELTNVGPVQKWKVSPDGEKLLYFGANRIGITFLKTQNKSGTPAPILIEREARILDVFWHSDSFHLIVVDERSIDVQEAKTGAEPLTLVVLGRKKGAPFYDTDTDTLYFSDFEKDENGKNYNNLYKLDLRNRSWPLEWPRGANKTDEPRTKN